MSFNGGVDGFRFNPGDIITTGSPAGVGFGRDPKVFMKPGDVVEVEVEGIGTLTNGISRANRTSEATL